MILIIDRVWEVWLGWEWLGDRVGFGISPWETDGEEGNLGVGWTQSGEMAQE